MPYFEYCTIQDLRDEGITPEECPDQRALTVIRRASAKINIYTSQWFAPIAGDQYIDGQNSPMAWLPNFVPINKLTAISVVKNRTARVGPRVLPDRRAYDIITLSDVQLSRNNRVVEIVGDVTEDFDAFYFRRYYNELEELWFPEGRRNIKLTGVFGWLEGDKDIESTVVGNWALKSPKIEIDDVSGWDVGDYCVFPDGSMQIVTGIKVSANELYFQADTFKLRTAVSDGENVNNYGMTPQLIRYAAIKLAHRMYPQLGDSTASADIFAQALVSERTDNYSYRLDPTLLRERFEAGANSTGDIEVDSILSQMVDEIPVYVGFA